MIYNDPFMKRSAPSFTRPRLRVEPCGDGTHFDPESRAIKADCCMTRVGEVDGGPRAGARTGGGHVHRVQRDHHHRNL